MASYKSGADKDVVRGVEIKLIRDTYGLSQKRLAELTHTSQARISRLENTGLIKKHLVLYIYWRLNETLGGINEQKEFKAKPKAVEEKTEKAT